MKPHTPRGRFLAPGSRDYVNRPLRELRAGADPSATFDDDHRRETEQVRDAATIRDEPECIGPAILNNYADVNRRIFTQQHVLEVAEAQERRPELAPRHRLADVQRRAKQAHVDLSHPIHLVQRAIDKARLRGQPVTPAALARLEGLESLLDGVSTRRLAA